jgi:integrase
MSNLTSQRSRERLKVRPEPHWTRLSAGAYLGYRRGAETWIARFRGRDLKQKYMSLGSADSLEFDQAKQAAEEWFAKLGATPVRAAKRGTVREALEAYVQHLRMHGREDAAKETEGRFSGVVWEDPFADLELERLTLDDSMEFRERLRAGKKKPRQNRSVNRHMRSIVAGLNTARELGHVGNPAAWKLRPLADDVDDDGDTAVFLDAAQRKAVIAASSPNAALFFRGLELTGARPKELAATTVSDFDGDSIKLAHRKGRPAKLRVRHAVLSAEGAKFFKAQVKDKLPAAFLFTEDGVRPWRRHVWAREMRAAVKTANLKLKGRARIPVENKETGDPGASAYSFRHARISELLQLHGVDPVTVAAQTGTSLAMIEKSYLKFIPSAMREKLEAIKEGGAKVPKKRKGA